MARAQAFWNLFLTKESIHSFEWNPPIGHPIDEIATLQAMTKQFEKNCLSFGEKELIEQLHFKTNWAENSLLCIYYILHVVNHNTHHRAQISVILRLKMGLDFTIPPTEYGIFLGNSTNKSA